jgi:hypothetical protein
MSDTAEMVGLLQEILKWNVVTSYGRVKETLNTVLSKRCDRLVYHLSNGKKSGLSISQESGVNNAAISGLQSKWTKMGLMRKTPTGYEKNFELEYFDMEIPTAEEIKGAKADKQKATR